MPDLALRLQSLLGQHSVVASDMMRARLRGDEDLAQVANAALSQNTDGLTQIVRSMFDEAAAGQFKPVWAAHVAQLFNYARGLATNDEAARNDAKAKLVEHEIDIARFFANASNGRLAAAGAEAALRTHVDQLLHQADAYAAKDYAEADRAYREAYAHTYALGKTLADTLAPPDQVAALNTPLWRLRSELSKLLGEHVVLVVAAMRAGVTYSPNFGTTANTVNGNTADLAMAVDTLFGVDAANRFQSLWADHVDQLMAYTSGVAMQDRQRREDARAKLDVFQSQLAAFLESATGQRMTSANLAQAFLSHDQMLLQQIDAFAARNYQQAHDLADATYQQMLELAGPLADAFGETVAKRLPGGGPHTGLGGAAGLAPPAVDAFRSTRTHPATPVPTRLRIPTAQVDTPLQAIGRAPDGSIMVPDDPNVAGWYAPGPRPGQPGPTVIVGHVDSAHAPAVFFRLFELTPGAAMYVDGSDGRTFPFRVTGLDRAPKDQFPTDLVYAPTLQPSLRLVTCGGSFDATARSYRDNVIVYADPA